jgi:predicted DNA-binding transcriptional regulator
MKRNFFSSFFLVMIVACSPTEKPLIDEKTYESLLYESELIFALHIQTMDTLLTQSLLDSMWITYNVTAEQFEKSHRLYERDVQKQLERVQRVAERLSKEHETLELKLYDLRQEELTERRREAGIE